MQTLIVISVIVAIIVILSIILGPLRTRRLAKKYERFRADHQAEHDAIDARFAHHEVEVNGIRWHYVEKGPVDGPVLLLMHGLPESWYSWAYVMPLIDSQYRVIAIDMKGYGRSEKSDGDFNWHTVGKQTVALMNHLKIDKFYVAGHDWGALISSVLVDDHQERILGYIRMQADYVPNPRRKRSSIYAQKPQWLIFQNTGLATFLLSDARFFVETVYIRANHTPMSRADLDYFIYEFSRPGVARCIALYFKRSNWDTETALYRFCKNRYDFPVMAIQADRDTRQPVSQFAASASECPCVELRWVRDSAHFDNLEQPQQVADLFNDFLKRSRSWKKDCA